MKTGILLLTAFILICGCTSVEFVRKDLTPNKQAVLRYPSQSSPSDDLKYLDQLNKEAREFCGGDYTTIKEYQAREDSNSSVGVGTGIGIGSGSVFLGSSGRGSSMYNYVEVGCR